MPLSSVSIINIMRGSTSQCMLATLYSRYNVACMYAVGGHSHVHIWVAGSGFDLPSVPHVAVIVALGTNTELHLKDISALQLTGEEEGGRYIPIYSHWESRHACRNHALTAGKSKLS